MKNYISREIVLHADEREDEYHQVRWSFDQGDGRSYGVNLKVPASISEDGWASYDLAAEWAFYDRQVSRGVALEAPAAPCQAINSPTFGLSEPLWLGV